jgi:hypothetical protein
MQNITFAFGLALLLGAMASNALAAGPGGSATIASSSAAASPTALPAVTSGTMTYGDVGGFGPSVPTATLAKLSGGTAVTEQMTLNGTVSQNTDDHVVTGSNAISSGSFTGAAGLPMVIQNTGSNVLIQNATIVNVQFQP